jgi:hypothetical protein
VRANGAARDDGERLAGTTDDEDEAGGVLTREEVNRTHRVRHGVYQRGGRLVSLLTDFGRINLCYPDEAAADGRTVIYAGEGRRGDQHLSPGNRALLAAVESGHAVPLFNKLSAGRWQHTGFWRVEAAARRFDAPEGRLLWRFRLRRADGGEAGATRGRRPL